jgi:hypothetical protein
MSKTIKEIKSFVINQMKIGQFASIVREDYEKYESDYIIITKEIITKEKKDLFISIKKSDLQLTLKDLNLSKLRFMILMIRVKKSASNFKERSKQEMISLKWNRFLDNNKDLKRDKKLNDILK